MQRQRAAMRALLPPRAAPAPSCPSTPLCPPHACARGPRHRWRHSHMALRLLQLKDGLAAALQRRCVEVHRGRRRRAARCGLAPGRRDGVAGACWALEEAAPEPTGGWAARWARGLACVLAASERWSCWL